MFGGAMPVVSLARAPWTEVPPLVKPEFNPPSYSLVMSGLHVLVQPIYALPVRQIAVGEPIPERTFVWEASCTDDKGIRLCRFMQRPPSPDPQVTMKFAEEEVWGMALEAINRVCDGADEEEEL